MTAATLLAALLLAAASPAQTPAPKPPAQPYPFSHKLHAVVGACEICHQTAAKAERAGLPALERCMLCHVEIKKGSPVIQRMAADQKQGKPAAWARVYHLADFVFFSHARHATAKVACASCHGPVQERDALFQEKPTSMAACMECHRSSKASLQCNVCHDVEF